SVLYVFTETIGLNANQHSFWKYIYTGETGNGGVWENRSDWQPIDNTLGSYAMILAVDPRNENIVYLGGTDLHVSTGGFTQGANQACLGGYCNWVLHPDTHILAFSPSNTTTYYCGTDGGIFRH